jgi:transcriptional regulator with XRE-family HTH domain
VKNNIRRYRRITELTQIGLAQKLKVSLSSVWRWENRKIEPRASQLRQMATLFGCDIKDLVESDGPDGGPA